MVSNSNCLQATKSTTLRGLRVVNFPCTESHLPHIHEHLTCIFEDGKLCHRSTYGPVNDES